MYVLFSLLWEPWQYVDYFMGNTCIWLRRCLSLSKEYTIKAFRLSCCYTCYVQDVTEKKYLPKCILSAPASFMCNQYLLCKTWYRGVQCRYAIQHLRSKICEEKHRSLLMLRRVNASESKQQTNNRKQTNNKY